MVARGELRVRGCAAKLSKDLISPVKRREGTKSGGDGRELSVFIKLTQHCEKEKGTRRN